MSDEGGAGEPLSDRQKREIAVWFLSNAPAGEIHYVAKDVRALLGDDAVYEAAAAEAFPEYNKARLVYFELPDRSGDPPAADKLSTLVPMAECKEMVKRKFDEAHDSDATGKDAGTSADQSKRQATRQTLAMGAPAATANDNPMFEILPRAPRLRVDPSYFNTLSARGEIGYRRTIATKELARKILEINFTELRRCMANVLNHSLKILYFDSGSMCDADINTELKAIVPVTIDVCMTALYAKLYIIHHDYGVHPSRYLTPPSFAKEIELPLPLALLIESFGTFETSCLTTNYLYIPTYPVNTQHEGRANAEYPITRYMSYASTFRELKVPMKAFEPHHKSGTPWWTYRVSTVYSTHDLICALPPTLRTYFSAELRSLLLIPDPDHNNEVQEIVTHPQNVAHYGFRMKVLHTGIAVRFLHSATSLMYFGSSLRDSIETENLEAPIIISTYGEIDKNNYLDPRTAQVATIDHMKQTCTKLRPAEDEELPSAYIEEFRCALDVELSKYVVEAYPKGACAVYCTSGKDIEGPGADFSFTAVISAAKRSPQNFCNGSWRSIWTMEFNYELQFVNIKGNIQVDAHYFEEGNVQLDTNIDRKDSTIMQSPDDCAVSITNIIRHHESEYLSSLEESYLNLSDATFKDLRRKLPVTRTLFPWHNTLALSLTRDLAKELALGK